MRKPARRPWIRWGLVAAGCLATAGVARAEDGPSPVGGRSPPRVLIVYYSGDPSQRHSPPLTAATVDASTHATTREINLDVVARSLEHDLRALGARVTRARVEDIRHPRELLEYDAIVVGSPVWFSNVAYPVKRFFDTHLIRLYEHRPERLNDKVLGGFVIVMETGDSGPRALQALVWGLEHLSGRIVEGIVANTSDPPARVREQTRAFAERIFAALHRRSP